MYYFWNMRPLIIFIMSLCPLLLQAQTYNTGLVEFINGQPRSLVLMETISAQEDGIPDSTFGILLDSNGSASQTVNISPKSIRTGILVPGTETFTFGPNPNNGTVDVFFNTANLTQLTASVFDLSGRLVQMATANTGRMSIDLSGLADGIYFARLQSDRKTGMIKLVKSSTATRQTGGWPSTGLHRNKTTATATPDTLSAGYAFSHNPGPGYVRIENENFIATIAGPNIIDLEQYITPWDTAYAHGGILTLTKNSGDQIHFVPLEIKTVKMDQIMINTILKDTSNAGGGLFYSNLPVSVDTTGNPANTNATYNISWPFVINPGLDSNKVNVKFVGWKAGDSTLTLIPGNNPNIDLQIEKVLPPKMMGKRYYQFNLRELKDGSPNSTNRDADTNAIIVVSYDNNTKLDTIKVKQNGPNIIGPFDHDDNIKIGFGYPGGKNLSGKRFHNYSNIEEKVKGATLKEVIDGDTIRTIKANLIPENLWSGMNDTLIKTGAMEIREAHQQPQYHSARFDTVGYYIYTANFNPIAINRIEEVADSASAYGPVKYVRVFTPFPNNVYDKNTATTFSHGANVKHGSNFISNLNAVYTEDEVKNEIESLVMVQVNVSGAINALWKEFVFQYSGHNGVASRTSVMNGNAAFPTDKDFAIYTLKYNVEHEMFRRDTLPTQNISIKYLSGDVNVKP
jgi:Secretion system C-terminal sorting domain